MITPSGVGAEAVRRQGGGGTKRRDSAGAMAASCTQSLKMMRCLNLTENICQQSYLVFSGNFETRHVLSITVLGKLIFGLVINVLLVANIRYMLSN